VLTIPHAKEHSKLNNPLFIISGFGIYGAAVVPDSKVGNYHSVNSPAFFNS